jgi:hypothetical protein
MIHPSTELRFINNEIGYGVVATEFIPKGTITWVFDKLDREFTGVELMGYDEIYQQLLSKYCFRNSAGKFVLCWDNARYVNHSFRSNCLSTAYDFELAVRDIQPGEELTDDYGYLNLTEPFRGRDEGSRRKHAYPDDLVRYHKVWDRKILAGFKQILRVDQPLRELVPQSTWETCTRISKGEEGLASILEIYFDPTTERDEKVEGGARRQE